MTVKRTGIGPERSLFSTFKRLNAVRLPMLEGTLYAMHMRTYIIVRVVG